MQAINFHKPATLHGWEHGIACSDRKCRDVLRDKKRGTVRLQASDSQTYCILRSVEHERQTKKKKGNDEEAIHTAPEARLLG